MDIILAGIASALAPINVGFVALGVSLGILVGAIPGLSAPMAIAIAVPLTYTLNPVSAIAFLLGVHKGGEYGGAISSILINTPGESRRPSRRWTVTRSHARATHERRS